MSPPDAKTGLSRRDFLVRGSFYGGGVWGAVNLPRPRALIPRAGPGT